MRPTNAAKRRQWSGPLLVSSNSISAALTKKTAEFLEREREESWLIASCREFRSVSGRLNCVSGRVFDSWTRWLLRPMGRRRRRRRRLLQLPSSLQASLSYLHSSPSLSPNSSSSSPPGPPSLSLSESLLLFTRNCLNFMLRALNYCYLGKELWVSWIRIYFLSRGRNKKEILGRDESAQNSVWS